MSSGAWTAVVIVATVVVVAIIVAFIIVRKKKGKPSCCSECSSCPYCSGQDNSVCSCHKDSTKP